MADKSEIQSKSAKDKETYRWSKTTYLHPKNYADVQFLKRAVKALLESHKIDIKKIEESRE